MDTDIAPRICIYAYIHISKVYFFHHIHLYIYINVMPETIFFQPKKKKKREKLEERGKGSRVRRTYSEKRMKKQPEW